MSPHHGTETTQLSQIIEVIQLGRKTGVLHVERNYQGRVETGEIHFLQGQISGARGGVYGELMGRDAVRWLRVWQACRFIFTSPTSTPVTQALGERVTQPLPRSVPEEYSPVTGHTTARLPAIQRTPVLPETKTPSGVPGLLYSTEQGLRLLEQVGLSRTHRHLLLLIDGRRSLAELSRLMGRREDDVQQALRDLVRTGIVSNPVR
jgi:hypothetical protein